MIRLPRARGRLTDDSGSLPLALLLILVAVSLSAAMTPMVLTQLEATRTDLRRVHALHAAQAGLDVATAQIRAAVDITGNGVLTALPCGPYAGPVGAAGNGRYQVSIAYYKEDPRGHDNGWLTSPVNKLVCSAGGGTLSTPQFARFVADGTDSPTGAFGTVPQRSLVATYIFQTTNQNLPGGLIHVFKDVTTTDLCMDAGTGSPAAGTDLQMHVCDATDPAQIWVYNKNLTLALSASKTTALPLGMCVDMAPLPSADRRAKLRPCGNATLPRQQWSTNDSGNFEGTTDGVTLNNLCLNVATPNAPGSFVVEGGCGGPANNVHTFSAEATVGAGAAGASSNQIVNFSQFGRCMDVTEFDINKGYLIVWPCKQAPDPTAVGWNQRFTMPTVVAPATFATGRVTTTNVVTYCLRTPGSTGPAQYVTVIVCPAITTAETTWRFNGLTTSYTTSYTVVDSNGFCLAPTDPKVDKYAGGGENANISKIKVSPCDGSASQKWNAPPNILRPSPLKDVSER